MQGKLSAQSVKQLALLISGGSGGFGSGNHYRTAGQLKEFMRDCGIDFTVKGSRIPDLVEEIDFWNDGPFGFDETAMTRIIERAVDVRDYIGEDALLQSEIKLLNEYLKFDGYSVEKDAQFYRFGPLPDAGINHELTDAAKVISFDTVQRDLLRALKSVESDPEDAVTAACAILESLFRSIIVETGEQLPQKMDIQSLYKVVKEILGLSPSRTDLPKDIAEDVRAILGGLNSVVVGIGALRTHAGDAHGRTHGHKQIDARIAKLAIYSALSASVFIYESWKRRGRKS